MSPKAFLRKYYHFILYLLIVICLNLFFFRIAFVYGESMQPTLHDGQVLLVRLFHYEPAASDIIITTKENPLHYNLIKRIIATEGDTVLITQTEVYINGLLLDEPYLEYTPVYTPLELTVPEGHVFVMGDNRNFSKDSRDIGCIPVSAILGKVVTRQ